MKISRNVHACLLQFQFICHVHAHIVLCHSYGNLNGNFSTRCWRNASPFHPYVRQEQANIFLFSFHFVDCALFYSPEASSNYHLIYEMKLKNARSPYRFFFVVCTVLCLVRLRNQTYDFDRSCVFSTNTQTNTRTASHKVVQTVLFLFILSYMFG